MLDAGCLVIGLNPALQRTLVLASALTVGGVHRARSSDTRAGGKGQGVAAAIAALEPTTSPVIVQLLGRDASRAGERVEEALSALGVEMLTGWFEGTTRTCVTIVSSLGLTTEVIEPSVDVPPSVVDELFERTLRVLPMQSTVVLAGTVPRGAETFYAKILEHMSTGVATAPLVILDCSRGLGELLATGRVDVLKVNREEVLDFAGAAASAGVAQDGSATALTDVALDNAARLILCKAGHGTDKQGGTSIGGLGQRRREAHARAGGAPAADGSDGGVLAVTNGGAPAVLFTMAADGSLRKWLVSVPTVAVVNAIGAGDVCTGVFAHKLANAGFTGQASSDVGAAGLCDALAWGIAAASARCTSLRPDGLSLADIFRLRTHVTIKEASVAPDAAAASSAP